MNFILFNPEEFCAENIGCYGHPLAPTPSMDRLAGEGVLFENCFVQHTVCSPSRCSFMTGWYPHVRGHRTLWYMLRPEEPNMLRYLKKSGYQIRWYGKNDLLAPESFADSVTSAESHGSGLFGQNLYKLEDPLYYSFLSEPYKGKIEDHSDYANVHAAIDFLRSKPEEPFLIYLPLAFPHPPYSAPSKWHDMIDPSELPALRPADLPNKPDFHRLIRKTRRLDKLDESHFRKIRAVYLGMIGFIDELLGQLVSCLHETKFSDRTAVFVFSDHGDYAGDYGLVEKWPSGLEDPLTRVPLIVRIPEGASNHVVKEPVEIFDVMPTVLKLAGIKPGHTHFARNLTPQLEGEPGDKNRAAFAEGGYSRHEAHCFEGRPGSAQMVGRDKTQIYYPKGKLQQDHPESVCRAVMIRTMSHKLIYRPEGISELYDLLADPQELHNIYGHSEHSKVQRQLEQRLLNWYVETGDVTPFDEDPRGLPTKP